MSQLGMGSMLHYLGGGSDEDPAKYYGKTVIAADINDERLLLTLDDGVKIKVWDDGQSCCEHRYITCDDDVKNIVGGRLIRIEAKDAPDIPDEYGDHECCFVEVATDKGWITMTTHNEHNGYYGGFGLSVTEINDAA